jgi:hypothetical protein
METLLNFESTKNLSVMLLKTYRNIARILIASLWLLSIGSAIFLARYGQLLPENDEKPKTLAASPQMRITDSSLVFSSSGAFMDYFRTRYKNAEITSNFFNSIDESGGPIIEVEKKKEAGKGNNNDKYKFRIKPVPQ